MREELLRLGEAARRASRRLMTASSGEKDAALEAIAAALEANAGRILAANAEDLANGRANGMPANLLDRMLLDEKRLAGIVTGVRQVAALKDPIGEVIHADTLPNGLIVSRSRVPLGVVGMIYEARPNVTVDAAALCLKSGNAVILRGSKDILCSNRALVEVMRQALEGAMPEAFQALAISLGSGHSLAQALRFVGNHAQEPVRSEFLQASLEISCGLSATDALNGLLERLPAPGMDLVSSALVVSQRTGAPLKDLLANAASMVGERIELARRLEVKTAQARLSARLVGVMPVAMMAALTLLSSDYRAGAASPGGALAIAVAMALDVCAWLLIRRIMEVRV